MQFTCLDGKVCVVTGVGSVTPSANPVILERDSSDEFFKPIRCVTGKVSFIDSGSALESLFPADSKTTAVTITYDGTLIFDGFLKSETYSQTYDGVNHVVTIPIHDKMSTLSGLYPAVVHGYKTVAEIMTMIKTAAGFTSVYMEEQWDAEKFNMDVWYDEVEDKTTGSFTYEPKSYEEILKDICQYLGCCARQNESTLYLVLPDSPNNAHAVTTFRGTNHTVSLLPPYSKIEISSSVEDYTTEIWSLNFEDFYGTNYKKIPMLSNELTYAPSKSSELTMGTITDLIMYAFANDGTSHSHDRVSCGAYSFSDPGSMTNYIYVQLGGSSSNIFNVTTKRNIYIPGDGNWGICIKGKAQLYDDSDSKNPKFGKKQTEEANFKFELAVGDKWRHGNQQWGDGAYKNTLKLGTDGEFCIYSYSQFTGNMTFGEDEKCVAKVNETLMGNVQFNLYGPTTSNDSPLFVITDFSIQLVHKKATTGYVSESKENKYTHKSNTGTNKVYSINNAITTAIGYQNGKNCVYTDTVYEEAFLTRLVATLGKKRKAMTLTTNFLNVGCNDSANGMAILGYKHDIFNSKTTLTLQEY